MMSLAILFGFGLVLSGIAIRIGIPLSHQMGVVDQPGGHKLHDFSTPFVGGIGVFVALLGTLALSATLPGMASAAAMAQWQALALGASIMFATGLADDIYHLGFKIRFLIQTGVAMVMVFGGGVVLTDLGNLAFGEKLELGWLAVPFTIFATVGVINALNMIDGIDGLSGLVSLVTLFLLALVAFVGGAYDYAILAAGLLGGVAAFLHFNMRYRSHPRARVFLGDNGSMLLGFLFAWMFIALSQEPTREIRPVTALWLFAIPLMDTLGVMLRRLWLGKSPFRPDRHHLHHLFIRAGFRVQDIAYAIALIHLVLGMIGVLGLWAGVHGTWMLAAYLLVFAAYFYLIARPWRFVPVLRRIHTGLGLTSPDTRGVFLGHCELSGAQDLIAGIKTEMKSRDDYRLCVYQTEREGRSDVYVYAVLEVLSEETEGTSEELKRLVESLKRRFKGKMGVRTRQFLTRSVDNDRRVGQKNTTQEARNADRRMKHRKKLIHSTHGTGCPDVDMA
ncbi:MAG: MraY family glycosyltransferase [Pseudomonadota bacterium]|nr:MraY family glycosyltransferase [Pseudomonadota bacterium]MDP2351170.1 MraY family glycosyltransferase [Pseudomonadota bacterium]